MALTEEQSAFLDLALRLRAEGARRVREGTREVAFDAPLPAEPPHDPATDLGQNERAELARLRAMAEEL